MKLLFVLLTLSLALMLGACEKENLSSSTSTSSSSTSSSSSSSTSSSSSSSSSTSSSSSSSSGSLKKLLNNTISLGMNLSTSFRYEFDPAGNFIDSDSGPCALDFKENGTGEWVFKNFAAAKFTWAEREGSLILKFDNAVIADSITAPEFALTGLNSGNYIPGSLVLDTLTISLPTTISASEVQTYTWQPTIRFVPTTPKLEYKPLVDDSYGYTEQLANAKSLSAPALLGAGNWLIVDNNLLAERLHLKTDGNATTESLNPGATANYWGTWSLKENYLALGNIGNDSAHTARLYALKDLEIGYDWVKIDEQSGKKTLSVGRMIKEQGPVTMTKSDWVGAWAMSAELILFTQDNQRFMGAGGWQNEWSFNENSQSLTWSAYQQGDRAWMINCNPVGSDGCKANYTQEFKMIGKSTAGYWALLRYEFLNGPVSESFVLLNKLAAVNQFGEWISKPSLTNFYQNTGGDYQVWSFENNKMLISNRAMTGLNTVTEAVPFEVKNGKLYFSENNVPNVLELLELSEQGLKVCKYEQGLSCSQGKEFWLSNRSPVQVNLAVNGGGYIDYLDLYGPTWQFGNPTQFRVKAKFGYSLQKVEGCGGALTGDIYKTVPIRSSCTVTATFIAN